jgi:hypothetical protein
MWPWCCQRSVFPEEDVEENDDVPALATARSLLGNSAAGPLGSFKSAPEDAGAMPDGSGRMAVSFKARRGRRGEALLQNEIRIFRIVQQRLQAREPGYSRIIAFVPERSYLEPQACVTLELVMPYGRDLQEFLEGGLRNVSTLLKAVSQMCEALRFLQDSGIVHGDLKSENVLLNLVHDIKLIDFGLAACKGETQRWPGNNNIPPDMRMRSMPAEFSQDLFGVGFILQHFEEHCPDFTKDVPQAAATRDRLMAREAATRMTLEELVQEPWIKDCRYSSGASSNDVASTISSSNSTPRPLLRSLVSTSRVASPATPQ